MWAWLMAMAMGGEKGEWFYVFIRCVTLHVVFFARFPFFIPGVWTGEHACGGIQRVGG